MPIWEVEDLTGLSAVAKVYGVSREAVHVWARGDGFPKPVTMIGRQGIYSRTQVADWYEQNRRRKPRAPRPLPVSKGPRGECGICGRKLALVGAGLIRRHTASGSRWTDWCPGSQTAPTVEAS